MSKEKVQDGKILLRLPVTLTAAVDQVVKEQLISQFPDLNRSEFMRRAIRFTLDNIDSFKSSSAATISEKEDVESVAKINNLRELYAQLKEYKDIIQKEPQAPNTVKQLSFLIFLIGEMLYTMND